MPSPFTLLGIAPHKEHDRKVARCHKLLEHIQEQAEKLQKATDDLPSDETDELCDKVELLLETADEMMEKVERLERR
jgi:ElaB/YqjD/DUF883 family membrane-anchored ribosome-binding protein